MSAEPPIFQDRWAEVFNCIAFGSVKINMTVASEESDIQTERNCGGTIIQGIRYN